VDDIPVSDVQRYEAEVRAYFRANHADLLDGIRTSGKLPEGDSLADALRSFTDTFDTGKVD
jgi:F-type H+-transporting ATPase subunit alpha